MQGSLFRRTISAICNKNRKIARVDLIVRSKKVHLLKHVIIFSLVFSILLFNVFSAYAQQPQLASFHEVAQVLVDQKFQNQTTAFIGLESTSPLEMRVPTGLDQKIHNITSITSVTICRKYL